MSASELYQTGRNRGLSGTLSGQNVAPPERPVVRSVADLYTPAPEYGADPALTLPQRPQEAVDPSGGGLGQVFPQAPPGSPGAFQAAIDARYGLRRAEEAGGGFAQGVASAAAWPFKAVWGVLSQLDRPQQFLYAAMVKGLETKDVFQGLEAGVSAFMFREPEPGGPKRRIEPEELIDRVAESMGYREGRFTRNLHPAESFMLQAGVALGLDPMLLVPGALYSKAGVAIKQFGHAVVAADHARYAISGGTDAVLQATKVRNLAIAKALREAGKEKGPLGRVILNVSQDLTDDEIALVRDVVTGSGVRLLSDDLTHMMAAAQGGPISPDAVAATLKNSLDRMDEGFVANLTDQVSELVAHRRAAPKHVEVFRVKVGGANRFVTFETAPSYPGATDAIAGQLMNRAGLAPTDAMERAGQVGRYITQVADERLAKAGIKAGASGALEVDSVKAWNSMSQASRRSVIARRAGRPVKDVVSRTFKTEAEMLSVLDPTEVAAARASYLDRAGVNASREAAINRRLFVRDAIQGDVPLPRGASKAYEAALRKVVGVGQVWVDAAFEARMRGRFKALDLEADAGRNVARIVAGVDEVDAMSDVPFQIANREVMTSMLDQSDHATKDMHLLTMVMDPKTVLPRPVWAFLKYSEDMGRAVRNAIHREMDKVFVVGGKTIKEGSELDNQVGLALFSDEMQELVAKGGASQNTQDFAARALEAKNALKENDAHWRVYSDVKASLEGFREAFIRRGFKEFSAGGINNYMARVYPKFEKSVQDALEAGIISEREAMHLLRRSRGSDINTAVSALDMDFVDGKHVAFRHLKGRAFIEPLPGLETSAISLMRSYIHGGVRKLYTEPAVMAVNDISRKMPKWQKRYTNLLLRRMLGLEVLDGEAINALAGQMNGMFGKAAQALTFGRVRADAEVFTAPRAATKTSLWITRNYYRGLLGFNFGFFLKNLAQGINTAVQLGPLEGMRGAAMLVSNPVVSEAGGKVTRFRDLVANRNLLRNVDDLLERGQYMGGVGGALKKVEVKIDDMLFSPAKHSEFINRGVAMAAGVTQEMRNAGFSSVSEFAAKAPEKFQDAVRYGHAIADETQFLYGVVGRSPIAGSPLGRMGLQFFSWPVKQVEFLRQGVKDEGAKFMVRYMALSGMFSHIAALAEVDARGFTGFGFLPSQAAPAPQAVMHLMAAVHSAAVDDNDEQSRKHWQRFVQQLEYMMPAMLQLQKTMAAAQSVATGESRGSRERFNRRTDDPNRDQPVSRLLDASLNRQLAKMGIPAISGEQAAEVLGLPSRPAEEFRKAIRSVEQDNVNTSRKYARWTDAYVRAYASGRYAEALEVASAAAKDGVFLDGPTIAREMAFKATPVARRVSEAIRPIERLRVGAEVFEKNPELFRHMPGVIPLPPDDLGGTR